MTNPRRKPAVMYDVARLAGVSHQTVSRVINGSEHVRAETRDRVLAAMRQLDYRPNSQARALVTGRSRTVGVITFDTALYGPASTLVSIGRAAHAAGYFVSVASVETLDRAEIVQAGRAAAGPRRRRHPRDRAARRGDERALGPAVRPSGRGRRGGPDEGVPVVAVDQYQGARLATEHLLGPGHATVHHIAGPPDWIEAQRRVDGWRDALEAAGARSSTPLQGDWSPRSGLRAGAPAARARRRHGGLRGQRPDGARPAALPARAGARRARRRQRGRLRRHPRGRVLHPAADDRAPGLREMGRRGVAPAARGDRLAGKRSGTRVTVPATLVERASTAAPSPSARA